LQGLILSNALRAQKDAEDEGCTIALNNLRSEVIELRNKGLEKDKILNSLLSKIKEDEAVSKAQAEAQKQEIEDLRKQLFEAKEKCVVAEAKREISDQRTKYLEKNIEELRISKEKCFEKAMDCVKRIKISFVNVGTYSSEENFIGPIPYMPLENILISCMPLAPHVIDTKKYTYMPLSGTQGMSIKSDGIPGIFSM
jgi:Ribonuclease G/E